MCFSNLRHVCFLSSACAWAAVVSVELSAIGRPAERAQMERATTLPNGQMNRADTTAVTGTSNLVSELTREAALATLATYRASLDAFRAEFGGVRAMPDIPFFQFGMGPRTKYLYRNGRLATAPGGTDYRSWTATNAVILPNEYTVMLLTADSGEVRIMENEAGVWIEEGGKRVLVPGTSTPVRLPMFAGHRHSAILRVLHHELLINVVEGKPVPNLYVYDRPWYRDGAMMAMCLARTGNLNVIQDWVLGLNEEFDRNNAGEREADNLGQVLYLISLVSDRNHPLVPRVLEAMKGFEVREEGGVYLKGRSDFAEHAVYQTKWAKFGLRALGLPDPYTIPAIPDSYSSLFWMDFGDRHLSGHEAADRELYPYLGWATDHFLREKRSPISNRDYPLTWEMQASQAKYDGISVIDPELASLKTATPHTWHAAEIFLYLLDER